MIYLIAEFILKRRVKLVLRGAYKLGAHLAVVCILALVFVTGGFGFTTRVPKPDDVKSADITYVGLSSLVSTRNASGFGDGSYYIPQDVTCTSADDLKLVEKLHSAVVAVGSRSYTAATKDYADTVVPYGIMVKYTLKNGSTLSRYYDKTTVAVLKQFLQLDTTQAVQQEISDIVSDTSSQSQTYSAYRYGTFYLANGWFGNIQKLMLDATDRARLLSAIRTDLAGQSVEDRYFSKSDVIGVLVAGNSTSEQSAVNLFGYVFDPRVYITDKYINTIAFLKEQGLYDRLSFNGSPELMKVSKYEPSNSYQMAIAKQVAPKSQVFQSYVERNDGVYQNTKSSTITDTEKMAGLMPLLRSNYFVDGGGYVVKVKLKGSDTVVGRFLPEADAPQYVKDLAK